MSGRVRGLFAGDAYMALEVCDTREFDGTLVEWRTTWRALPPPAPERERRRL
jgi:hypothetical protein